MFGFSRAPQAKQPNALTATARDAYRIFGGGGLDALSGVADAVLQPMLGPLSTVRQAAALVPSLQHPMTRPQAIPPAPYMPMSVLAQQVVPQPKSLPAKIARFGTSLAIPLPAKAAQVATDVEKAAAPIIAYHGSPHQFDAFDLSKIGTGEGAQAYGHGLYFAEEPKVAQSYRDTLANGRMLPPELLAQYFTPGRVIKGYGGYDKVVGFRPGPADNPWGWSVDVINSDAAGNALPGARIRNHATQPDATQVNSVLGGGAGHMYQVAINADPSQFLDWDAPLSREEVEQKFSGFPSVLDADARQRAFLGADKGYTGKAAYAQAAGWNTSAQLSPQSAAEVSQRLASQGTPGIKYFDWGSRGTGQGTRNYVVFDPSLVSILKRYAIPAAVTAGGAGAALSQQPGQRPFFGFGSAPMTYQGNALTGQPRTF